MIASSVTVKHGPIILCVCVYNLTKVQNSFHGSFNISFQVLDKYDSSKTIKSISSDGTPVNTGLDNGANRILEELVDMALQWLVCDLHCNELLFRHLFCKIGKEKNISIFER